MRKFGNVVSWVLCAAMLMTMLFPFSSVAFAADEEQSGGMAVGNITATLRFDYPQILENVKSKKITAALSRGNELLGSVILDGSKSVKYAQYNAQVIAKNRYGTEISTEAEIGYFDISVFDLPLGSYTFTFSGDGYTEYTTPAIKLEDYSQQVIIGTGDATFTIGDVNRDNKVDILDRTLLTEALGKQDAENLNKCDFNGDGKIDIIDLAYVNHQIDAVGEAEVIDTSLIAQNVVDLRGAQETLTVAQGQKMEDLFVSGGGAVKLTAKDKKSDFIIPIEFKQESGVEMEEINIISPAAEGAVVSGTAILRLANGEEEVIPFDNSIPENVYAIETRAGSNRVVISLGKRVAVKEVIIKVDTVIDQKGTPEFVVIEEIQFLKNIVPENPINMNNKVKNVKAEPLNESVKLTWNEFPNITGYKVYYGEKSGAYSNELTVQVTSATITGLKNLQTYYFAVSPISEGWEGGRSDEISAIPQPNAVPKKPDMVVVTGQDRALKVSWKKTENASYYRVFYKEAESESDYRQFGGDIAETNVAIGGLTNQKEYYIYVTAGNKIGVGPRSEIAVGIPDKEDIDAPDIPTLHMIDRSNIEKIEMANTSNVMMSEYPNGFDVWNVADGDYATHWTAATWSKSDQFTFTFKEVKEMNYMVYVPRLDGAYRKSLARYSIIVWDEDGNQRNLVSNKNIPINSTTTGYMILPFEKTKVKKLAVSIAQWEGSPTNRSLSEAVFYESDNLAADVRGLFADNAYTTLVSGVTQEQIDVLRAQAEDARGYYVDKDVLLDELSLAEKLLKGDSDALGHVKRGIQSRSTGADSSKYGQAGSDLQPLGVVAYANQKLTVYAQIPEGETLSLIPTQHFAEANAWQGAAISLQNGRNEIIVPKIGSQASESGGSLYLRYSGANPEDVVLQVRMSGTVIPVLELADWYGLDETARKAQINTYVENLVAYTTTYKTQMNQTSVRNATEISMPNVLLSIPASCALAGVKPTGADTETAVQNLYNSILAWEDMMHIVNTTQGIDNTLENSDMQSRQNIRYMKMFANAFMYAAGNHIGIGFGSCSGMVGGRPISMMADDAAYNGLFGWGIAHEIGHNMDKLGKAEITNNIYALMAQTYDGKQNTLKSRLELSGKYEGIYDKVSAGYPGASNNVFVQLGMYWQLHLAYDNGEDPMAFYNQLFKRWKGGAYSGNSYDDRFALVASEIAGKDLTEFFTRWGMRLSDATKEALRQYPAETRSIWYLNDDSRRYRLASGTAGSGKTTASAVHGTDNTTVLVTMSNTQRDDVLGYEILRNGKSIAFTTSDTYTDIIGSANNMAFSYTVKTVDKLGNVIDVTEAGQVRISYDRTIDASRYTWTANPDGSVSAVMQEETAVSGIKVTGAPAAGAFTVEIKKADSEQFVTAKNGDFAVSDAQEGRDYYLAYFNKPGAPEDTRIWTFDAQEIKVTGVPSDATIEFISYPGDNIAFTANAAVGVLEEDYRYGEGDGQVIAAGTLIVTGTYRGDPVYNTLRIVGKYPYVNPQTDEESVAERPVDGKAIFFAEVPEDGEVSDISDGIFIFVPTEQHDVVWESIQTDCGAATLLPAEIKAELYRTDQAESAESKRLTSNTMWIGTPGGAELPTIVLK